MKTQLFAPDIDSIIDHIKREIYRELSNCQIREPAL